MSMKLCVAVWNWDHLEQHEFLGGIILPLCSYELDTVEKKWYNLRDDVVSLLLCSTNRNCCYKNPSNMLIVVPNNFNETLLLF